MREIAIQIVRRLRDAGYTAYFAGGCVRDMLRGAEPTDYDMATSARPEEVRRLFERTVEVGAQFGVVLVVEGEHRFEVATFRSDEAYLDGRRPSGVVFSTPESDAQRRDFTVNGIFYDPIEERVIDFVGGQEDIRKKLIRTIGAPKERFTEDKLRLLRCVRFASTLGYEIDAETFDAVREMASQIRVVSAERIRDELVKMFTRPGGGRGLRLMEDGGLLDTILPEVHAMKGVEQPRQYHPEGDVFVHTALMMDEVGRTIAGGGLQIAEQRDVETLAFAALLHDIGKPPTFEITTEKDGSERIRFNFHDSVGAEMAEHVLRRLRFSNEETENVVACVANHMRFKDVDKMRPGKLKNLLARPTFTVELELHRIDCVASHGNLENYYFLKKKSEELSQEEVKPLPLLTGDDLLAMGYAEGPLIGEILGEVRELQLDEKLSTREDAAKWVAEKYGK